MGIFQITIPENTVVVTISDNYGYYGTEWVLVADDPRAIVTAVSQYADRNYIRRADRIRYAVKPYDGKTHIFPLEVPNEWTRPCRCPRCTTKTKKET